MATAKVLKVPGAKMPKIGPNLPSVPKAPQLGTTAQNLRPYAQSAKKPTMTPGLPKLPKGRF